MAGEHGQTVRPDLVRGVTVRRDTVGAGKDDVHQATCHERRGRAVCDHRERDAEPFELPCREPRTLIRAAASPSPRHARRASLATEPDRAERRPVSARRQRARCCNGSARACPAAAGSWRARPCARSAPLLPRGSPSRARGRIISHRSSAHARLTAVGRDDRSTRSASSRSWPSSAASA